MLAAFFATKNLASSSLLPFLAFLPSLIWLVFYYRRDRHPEPKNLILRIFLWGIFLALPIYLLELFFRFAFQPDLTLAELVSLPLPAPIYLGLIFLAGPLIEEFFKLGIVRFHFLKNPDFDEPADLLVYAAVVGLGFAGVENLIFAWQAVSAANAFLVIATRAVTSTLLHAAAPALGAYFLARAIKKSRPVLMLWGLALATFFHSCYNYLIWQKSQSGGVVFSSFLFALIFGLLLFLTLLVLRYFIKLNRQSSVCQINGGRR